MSERRDYSQVAWPWDDDPNWEAPREGATSDPGDNDNWTLACDECRLRFPVEITIGAAAAHWDEQHPERTSSDDGGLELQLVWIGLGPPPEANPLT